MTQPFRPPLPRTPLNALIDCGRAWGAALAELARLFREVVMTRNQPDPADRDRPWPNMPPPSTHPGDDMPVPTQPNPRQPR